MKLTSSFGNQPLPYDGFAEVWVEDVEDYASWLKDPKNTAILKGTLCHDFLGFYEWN